MTEIIHAIYMFVNPNQNNTNKKFEKKGPLKNYWINMLFLKERDKPNHDNQQKKRYNQSNRHLENLCKYSFFKSKLVLLSRIMTDCQPNLTGINIENCDCEF